MGTYKPTAEQELDLINNPTGFTQDNSEEILKEIAKNTKDLLDSVYKEGKIIKNKLIKEKVTSKRQKKEEFGQVLKMGTFGKMEKACLRFLDDFEPHTLKDIELKIKTKACKQLKYRLNKKLKKNKFVIKVHKVQSFQEKSYYQLNYLS